MVVRFQPKKNTSTASAISSVSVRTKKRVLISTEFFSVRRKVFS